MEAQTIESNRIITEFLGFTLHKDYPWMLNNLKYHSCWDCLMPVVEKIEHIENADFIVYINVECCKITAIETHPDLLIIETAKTKIEATYKAIVEFIKWHNELKK